MTPALASLSSSFVHTPRNQIAQHDPRAWKVAQDFESQILSTLTQSMFEGVKTDGPFGGGEGEGVFRSMLTEQYGKEMSRAGGIGLADMIYGEILKMQEGK